MERLPGRGRRLLRHEPGHARARRAAHPGDLVRVVERLDNQTFYGFLCDSEAFKSFRHREIFGQVGFGTGGWDTDFPNSILEILRVVYTEADDHHRGIVGGSQQLPLRLWEREPQKIVHWPYGTSLRSLHEGGEPRPAVTRLHRTAGDRITVTDAQGHIRTYRAAVFTAQSWMLLSKIACDDALFPIDHWTAIERTHYMESSKLFVPVDRPFWLDKDEETGRDVMSMTLTDRMTRGTYLLDDGPDRPAVICLSYTWCDDSLKWLPLSANERMEVMLKSLGEIYPKVDIRKHIIGNPVTVSWENEPYFMGAFKAEPARSLPLPAAPVHALHAGPAARREAGHLPRRRRHLLDGRLGGGRGADRAQRRVGRHAPLRWRNRPVQPRPR